MSNEVREPKQKRSIETKKKIITASFELFSEEGYYNTNTAEIAKRAGVSTGIVYGYFKDKRDILLDVSELYIENVYRPILKIFDMMEKPLVPEKLVPQIIDGAILTHKKNANIHEALHSLTHVDDAVNEKFIQLEDRITIQFADKLTEFGFKTEFIMEKIHLAMNIVQSFAHEFVFDKHAYIDYDQMRVIVCENIVGLFKN